MAKAKNLAILAGLAGLAYANRDKLGFGSKDKDDKRTDARSPGDEMSSAASRKMPDDDRMSNEDYIKSRMKKAPEDEKGSAQSDVLKAVTAPKAASNDKASNQGVLPPKSSGKSAAAKQAPSDRRTSESGMSRGTRPAVAKNPNYSNEGRNSVAPAKNPNYSNEGRSSTAPTIASKVGNIAKDTAVAAVKAANPVATAAYEFGTTPTSEQASANRQAAYDKVKSAGSKVVDYVKNFETPAERRSREAKESKDTPPKARTDSPLGRKMESEVLNNMITNPPMRKGGAVKMASGGMTASRRGDGIASRGKTRGKIC